MNDLSLWDLMWEAWVKVNKAYQPVVEPFIQASGLEWRILGLLLAALTFEPEDTTPGHLTVRGPYTSPDAYLDRLRLAAEGGYLEEISEKRFRLTARGRETTLGFIRLARQAIDDANPLSEDETNQLSGYLNKLVTACLETPPPPETWSIRLSSKLLPEETNKLSYIEQTFSCLEAYRDDSHLAAWQSSRLSAVALETLTLLWREEVKSLDQLVEKVSHRGYARQVYADGIAELRSRNYVSGVNSALRVTHEGRRFRQRVEDDTNRYFFAPWTCLIDQEKNALVGILIRLRDNMP